MEVDPPTNIWWEQRKKGKGKGKGKGKNRANNYWWHDRRRSRSRDREAGDARSSTDMAPATPPLPPRHEEMVRISGKELDNIIRCLNYNVDIGMHNFSLSKAATEQFEEHKNKIRKLQHDFERYLIY